MVIHFVRLHSLFSSERWRRPDLALANRIEDHGAMASVDDSTLDSAALTSKIRELLSARSANSSICPSDVARAMKPDDWRPLMDPVREAAGALVDAGEVEITQKGEVVDLGSVRGPIRIRWAR